MDPLSIAVSIAGLIRAGIQITSIAQQFISSCSNAPALAQYVKAQVYDFVVVLSSLQPIVLGSLHNVSHSSLIDIDQLVVTLTTSMCTFSELEAEVDRLSVHDPTGLRSKLKWARARSTVTELLQRVQQHKISLNLMLTILTCASSAEAAISVKRLCKIVEDMTNRLEQHDLSPGTSNPANYPASPFNEPESSSASTIRRPNSPGIQNSNTSFMSTYATQTPAPASRGTYIQSSSESLRTVTSYRFEATLLRSPVYARVIFGKQLPSADAQADWSVISGRSLAEISNISVLSMPLDTSSLNNSWWYNDTTIAPDGESFYGIKLNNPHLLSTDLEQARLRMFSSSSVLGVDKIYVANGFGYWCLNSLSWLDAISVIQLTETRPGTADISQSSEFAPTDSAAELDGMPLQYIPRQALFWSKLNSQHELNDLLLEGFSINSLDTQGHTLLSWAVKRKNDGMVKLLLENGADVGYWDISGKTPFQLACINGYSHLVDTLLDYEDQGKVSHFGLENLAYASQIAGCFDEVSYFLLRAAVDRGYKSTTLKLLSDGARPYRYDQLNDRSLVATAIVKGRESIVEPLLRAGARAHDPGDGGMTLLCYAAKYGRAQSVELLLGWGASCEAWDRRSLSAYDVAVLNKQSHIVVLLERLGQTPLHTHQEHPILMHRAAQYGYLDLVRLLLENGEGTEQFDKRGYTTLHIAIEYNQEAIVSTLLDHGTETQIKSMSGLTALELAIELGHLNIARQIVRISRSNAHIPSA